MQITLRERLEQFAHLSQTELFARLEERIGSLSEKARLLVSVTGMISLHRCLPPSRGWRGRRSKDRHALAIAFLAKAVLGLETTRQLLERLKTDAQLRCLCGWNNAHHIPHESTFSRAFAEFAATELPQRLHEVLIKDTQQNRLVGHITRDSTAIEARERFDTLPKHKPLPKRGRGRPRKAERALSGRRLPRQRRQNVQEMLSELPRHCSIGAKTSSKGHQKYWRGYKLHIDVADGQIPITCLLTAASLHDSQAAIPLATLTAERVRSLYDVMDSAYDASEIHAHSRSLGHVPLIAPNGSLAPVPPKVQASLRRYDKRRKVPQRYDRKRPPFTPAEEDRYRIRTMSERVNARLKDEFGCRTVRVRGAPKVMAHLMFGVLALTVDQLLRLLQ
jgi:hypothetical protein